MRFNTALDYLTYLLAKREYCTSQVRIKMICKGFDRKEVEEAIVQAKKLNYLSDARFVESFIHDQVLLSKNGKFQIINKLKTKGINNTELIEDIMRIMDINWGEVCTEFLQQKGCTSADFKDIKTRQKLIRNSLSKGFTLDDIKYAQIAIAQSEDDLENEFERFDHNEI